MKRSAAEVLAYLRTRPDGCTSKDAWQDIGCSRLAARVNELRGMGYPVTSELVMLRSGDRPVRVARYRLVDAPRQLEMAL